MTTEPKPELILAAQLMLEAIANGETVTAYRVALDARALIALGRSADRLALDRCNGIERYDEKAGRVLAQWTEKDEARAERTSERITAKAAELLAPYGATVAQVGGDPRGYCLKLKLKSGASNGMGEDWGV